MSVQPVSSAKSPLDDSERFSSIQKPISQINTDARVHELVNQAKNLKPDDAQLLVDVLSMVLDKGIASIQIQSYIRSALVRVASTANVLSRSRIIMLMTAELDSGIGVLPSGHIYCGGGSIRLKTRGRSRDVAEATRNVLLGWVHMVHVNVFPLYATFFKGEDHPSFVIPCTTDVTMSNFAETLSTDHRILLAFDVINGLECIHQLDIVHGGISPESILVSSHGRAMITDLDVMCAAEDPDLPPRYSAPELLVASEFSPTKASDVWSFGCISYEMISGNTPFCQLLRDNKVLAVVAKGSKPIRPGTEGLEGKEIVDVIWNILQACWKYDPENRPDCTRIKQVFVSVNVIDDRPEEKSTAIWPEASTAPAFDRERAYTILTQALGADQPSTMEVPENLSSLLSQLLDGPTKANLTAAAAKKLSPDDTQVLVDFLEQIIGGIPLGEFNAQARYNELLVSIMKSTHVLPRFYTIGGVHYDPTTHVEKNPYMKAFKAHGLNVRVNFPDLAEGSASRFFRWLTSWAKHSHPNLTPFYGVFHEFLPDSLRLGVLTPLFENGTLRRYAPTLIQRDRLPLLSDVVEGLIYLHTVMNVYAGGLSGDAVLISGEGRAIIATFGEEYFFRTGDTAGQAHAYWARFAGPRLSGKARDKWSFGCLSYEALTRKMPYYQLNDRQSKSARYRGVPPVRPEYTSDEIDEIEDQAWDMIMKCCVDDEERQPTLLEIREMLAKMTQEDHRPTQEETSFNTGILPLRSRPDVDFERTRVILNTLQAELLRPQLLDIVRNRTKNIAAIMTECQRDDIHCMVDFLDEALRNSSTMPKERNRVLGVLSRVTSLTHIFPRRYELKGISYRTPAIAEGGFGRVHLGVDKSLCIKVIMRLDPDALAMWIKEVILWAHSSHPNVLPFYGVFLEGPVDSPQTCLVSPFMKNGNLYDYSPRLPQKSRLPLISDVVRGLEYLHDLGIVHGDLKGQNVLISDEGRALITDFGASQITTATAASSILSTVTLRFSAPEFILGNKKPTKQLDIWAFGCLKYQVLSKKAPYYQYLMEVQIMSALARKEPLARPGSIAKDPEEEENDWDDDLEEDWDTIDDQSWSLIMKCCALEPEDRPEAGEIFKLIKNLKFWDERPTAKLISNATISDLGSNPKVDLNRVELLLERVKQALAQHSPSLPHH